MSLHVSDPDPAAVATVRDQLPRLVASPTFDPQTAVDLVISTDVALAVPHDVYALGLDDVVRGAGLGGASVVAQQFLLMNGSTPVAAIEIRDQAETIQLTGGSLAQLMADAVDRADQDPALDGAQVRLLLISALHVTALWLHDPVAGFDQLVPLGNPPAPVVADGQYDPAVLLDLLTDAAQEILDNAGNGAIGG